MKATEIKLDLLNKIEQSNVQELKEIYGLILNYFNKQENTEEWELLSAAQREKIELGIQQADNNELHPLNQVTKELRRKYGIND